jgi:outer membrane protein OmpA-like peptidoglycan-associated protein
LVSLFWLVSAQAQDKYVKKTADENFSIQNYPEAIRLYETLLLKEAADSSSMRKLAVCYLKTKQPLKAEQLLLNLQSTYGISESTRYMYGSVLCMNGKYSMATDCFEKILQKNPSHAMARKALDDIYQIHQFYKDSSQVRLYQLGFNTSLPEFSPLIVNQQLLFVSTRTDQSMIKRVQEWNNTPYLDIYGIAISNIPKKIQPNAPLQLPEENSIVFGSQRKLHESLTRETSNDNNTPLAYHPSIQSDSSKRNDKNLGVSLFDKNINRTYHEGPASYCSATQQFFFTSNLPVTKKARLNSLAIYVATADAEGQLSEPILLDLCPKAYSAAHPAISSDGKTLVFSSNMPGGKGGMDLYRCTKKENGWSKPENLREINTAGDEVFPFLNKNNLLFFSSNGHGGLGGLEIVYTHLEYFNSLKNPGYPINSSRDDFGVYIQDDGKSGYLSSNRIGHSDDDNIFYFEATNPFTAEEPTMNKRLFTLKGILREKENKIPVQTMIALFKNDERNLIDIIYSDSSGFFKIQLPEKQKYILKIADAKYYIISDTINHKREEEINRYYFLEFNKAITNVDSIREKWKPYVAKVTLQGKVEDAKTQAPLEAIIKITSLIDTTNASITISDFDGYFSAALPYAGPYTVDLLSEGYKLTTLVTEARNGLNAQTFQMNKIRSDFDSLQTIWIKKKFKGKLNGLVLAEPGKEPLTDIVALYPEGDTLLENYSFSDFDGRYQLLMKKGVPYTLVVQDNERGDLVKRILLPEDDSVLVDTTLFPLRKEKVKVDIDSIAKSFNEQDSLYNLTYQAILLDEDTKEPVDALIAIQSNPEGSPEEVTASDFNGAFQFKIRKHKSYYVSFVSQDYESYKMIINSDDPSLLPSKVYLKKLKDARITDSVIAVYKTKLNEKATLLGNIATLEENEPLMAFIAVYIDGEENPVDVHPSDEMGNFSFTLKKGELYKIEVMELGFLPLQEFLNTADTTSIFKRDFKLKRPIKKEVFDSLNTDWKEKAVVIEQKRKQASDSLDTYKTFKGYVFEVENYKPVEARITIVDHSDPVHYSDTTANIEGKYAVDLKIGHDYTLYFEAHGYRPDSAVVHVSRGSKKSQSVILLSRDYSVKHSRKMEPVKFSAFVVDMITKEPVETVVGLFSGHENNLVDLLHTDAKGNCTTLLFPESKYIIKIADERYALFTDSFTTQVGNVAFKYSLIKNILPSNADSIKKSLQKFIPPISLMGSIRSASDSLWKGSDAIVKIVKRDKSGIDFFAMSNEEGIVNQELPEEGTYYISVLAEGFALYESELKIKKGLNQQIFLLEKIHASYDSIKALWTRKFKGTLRGLVLQDSIIALSDFVVAFEEGDTILSNYTISDFDGRYQLPVKKETHYTILVQDSEMGDQLAKVYVNDQDSVVIKNFRFNKNANPVRIDFDSLAKYYYQLNQEYNTNYRATVVDAITHKPVEALVALQSQASEEPEEVTATDEAGKFSFQIRKEKNFYLTVVSENYQSKSLTIHSGNKFPDTISLVRIPEVADMDKLLAKYRKELSRKVQFFGRVEEEKSKDPVAAFAALYTNSQKAPLEVFPADFNGDFSFQLEKNKMYSIEIIEPGFLPLQYELNTFDTSLVLTRHFYLKSPQENSVYDSIQRSWKSQEENFKTTIYGSIKDKKSDQGISTDILVLQPDKKNELAHSYSNHKGDYQLSTPTREQYQVKVGKDNVYIINNPTKSRIIYKNYYLDAANVLAKDNSDKSPRSYYDDKGKEHVEFIGPDHSIPSSNYHPLYYISFNTNEFALRPYQKHQLHPLVSLMKQDTSLNVTIVGHADNSGNDSSNTILSNKRALFVLDELLVAGIQPSRLAVKGLGDRKPFVSNKSATGRRINRRVEFEFSNMNKDSLLILYQTGITNQYSIPRKYWQSKTFIPQVKELLAQSRPVRLHFEVFINNEGRAAIMFDAINRLLLAANIRTEFTYSILHNEQMAKDAAVVELYLISK